MFSVVRGYNILFIIIAQFISSIYMLSENGSILGVVYDLNIWLIIFSSAFSISAGYIINNVFDSEKDLINRPLKTTLEKEISGRTKLLVYVFLNIITLTLAFLVSLKAFFFFSIYIIGIIIYSIKISKYPFIGNLFSVILAITPFFAIILYYKNYSIEIFSHALFLFLIVLIREVVKDLENFVGDFTLNYFTIPVKYGEQVSKAYISFCSILVLIVTYLILVFYELSYMKYFYLFNYIFFALFNYYIWNSDSKDNYQYLHNSLKLLIVLGLFSIILHGI
ncbi:UbiA family prenyltransferase [Flavobacteriaceae bacterium]|nr:UbiA family prenyltransferase [Flavobacteriaceae bacterium]